MNNTTGINITEEEFLKMFEEKESSKKKKGRSTTKSSRSKESRQYGIDYPRFDPPVNENSIEYEEIVRNQLDLAIEQTERVLSTADPSLL